MHAISVKELRTKFPFIRSELKKGTRFLIIYKSKPIAELSPVKGLPNYKEATDEDVEKAAAADMLRMIPPMTKEEHDYYMSLAPYKD